MAGPGKLGLPAMGTFIGTILGLYPQNMICFLEFGCLSMQHRDTVTPSRTIDDKAI